MVEPKIAQPLETFKADETSREELRHMVGHLDVFLHLHKSGSSRFANITDERIRVDLKFKKVTYLIETVTKTHIRLIYLPEKGRGRCSR